MFIIWSLSYISLYHLKTNSNCMQFLQIYFCIFCGHQRLSYSLQRFTSAVTPYSLLPDYSLAASEVSLFLIYQKDQSKGKYSKCRIDLVHQCCILPYLILRTASFLEQGFYFILVCVVSNTMESKSLMCVVLKTNKLPIFFGSKENKASKKEMKLYF